MTRKEAEDFIYSSYTRALPYIEYDRPDSEKRDPSLTEDIIKRHHSGRTTVTVTGSKGKGSAAYILSEILGVTKSVGLMTSPHIDRFNERFRICGEVISDYEFTKIAEDIRPEFDRIEDRLDKNHFISPIGIETVIAEEFFKRHGAVFEIYECGKGVRYDDVRNVPASYAMINSIFLEHTRELGPDIADIAENKADIIKNGMKSVFIGRQDEAVKTILVKQALLQNVPVKLYGEDFEACNIRYTEQGMECDIRLGNEIINNVGISLMGSDQCSNLALAFACAKEIMGECFYEKLEDIRVVLKGLHFPGRLSIIKRSPFIMADCCINRTSITNVIETIKRLGLKEAVFVIAIPDDKDYIGVAEEISAKGCDIILTKVANKHYRFNGIQQDVLYKAGIAARYFGSLREAILEAGEPVVVVGTTAMLKELKEIFGEI